jgi:hypothetical protein
LGGRPLGRHFQCLSFEKLLLSNGFRAQYNNLRGYSRVLGTRARTFSHVRFRSRDLAFDSFEIAETLSISQ